MMKKEKIRLFPYYGSKNKAAAKYPEPQSNLIIEPFAGSAGYSCLYHDHDVLLNDLNPVICDVLNYLIAAGKHDILNLPLIPPGNSVDDFNISDVEKWLIGFWLNTSSTAPGKQLSKWGRKAWAAQEVNFWGPRCRERLSRHVGYIDHWKVTSVDYAILRNDVATWFVDPPYQQMGKFYTCNTIDYARLGAWCKNRQGQVIVCEQQGADWLDFSCLFTNFSAGKKRRHSNELIWNSNDSTPTLFSENK
jgi:site-specific DNA-adenine methylase